MRATTFLLLIILHVNAFGQEVPIATKQGNWQMSPEVVLYANRILDSVGSVLRVDTSFLLNDSIVSLRGYTIDNNKRASERLIVRRFNDTIWTTMDPYISTQYFSCTETDCCSICDKGATSCICQASPCTKSVCDERTYGSNYPATGLSNAVRTYLIYK